jgi:hypothetical protein
VVGFLVWNGLFSFLEFFLAGFLFLVEVNLGRILFEKLRAYLGFIKN